MTASSHPAGGTIPGLLLENSGLHSNPPILKYFHRGEFASLADSGKRAADEDHKRDILQQVREKAGYRCKGPLGERSFLARMRVLQKLRAENCHPAYSDLPGIYRGLLQHPRI